MISYELRLTVLMGGRLAYWIVKKNGSFICVVSDSHDFSVADLTVRCRPAQVYYGNVRALSKPFANGRFDDTRLTRSVVPLFMRS